MTTPHATITAAAAALMLAAGIAATPAAAHVTLQPKTAVAGEYTVENVRVPNETDDADTVRVTVQLPPGFASVSYARVPGWSVTVKKEKLAVPIKTDDGDITEGVAQVTWTGHGTAGRIRPGQFQDFPLSVRIPGKAGDTLTFKAIQRYDDGEVVRWIGSPAADEPAPTVKLVAATGASTAIPSGATDVDGGSGDDGGNTAALVVAILAALLAGAALVSARWRRPASA